MKNLLEDSQRFHKEIVQKSYNQNINGLTYEKLRVCAIHVELTLLNAQKKTQRMVRLYVLLLQFPTKGSVINELTQMKTKSHIISKSWLVNAKICSKKMVGLYLMLPQLITEVLTKLFQNFLKCFEVPNPWANTHEKHKKSRNY